MSDLGAGITAVCQEGLDEAGRCAHHGPANEHKTVGNLKRFH